MGRAARPWRERHVLGLHPRARGEDDVPEAGLPFIDPQQIVVHRKAEVGRQQPGRAAIFAVPAMGKLVRQQAAQHFSLVPFGEIFGLAAVFAAAMIQSEERGVGKRWDTKDKYMWSP